jgi:hypothetical protein
MIRQTIPPFSMKKRLINCLVRSAGKTIVTQAASG